MLFVAFVAHATVQVMCRSVRRARPRFHAGTLLRGAAAACEPGTGQTRGALAHGPSPTSAPSRSRALVASIALVALSAGPARAGCDAAALRFERLGPQLWLLRAHAAESTPANGGFTSNLVLARDGARTWLVGSGPTPAFGARVACAVRERFGVAVTDVIDPWPHPELVMGNAAFDGARLWAAAPVAEAMRTQCPRCVARLRERIGVAGDGLDERAVRVPAALPQDAPGRGTIGPWRWQVVARGTDAPATLLRHAPSNVALAHGLLWVGAAPDLRDASLASMREATRTLRGAARRDGVARWVGEQGPPGGVGDLERQQRYWHALQRALDAAIAAGRDDAARPVALPGLARGDVSRHALNWQRAWREREQRWLDAQRAHDGRGADGAAGVPAPRAPESRGEPARR